MSTMEKLAMYMGESFVRYAFVVGVLIALCASLVGVTLVLKRFSFIGHGLSNVAFGTIAIASAMSVASESLANALNLTNNLIIVMPITIISSVLLLRTTQNAKVNGDAAIAMISVGTLAVGYLVMNLFPSQNLAGDICSMLFGSTSILTLQMTDVWVSIGLSVFVIAIFVLFYNKIFSVTFDEDFTSATGIKSKAYNTVLAVVVAVIIVLAINLVGTLLISALIIFPALSAMRLFKSFLSVTICSVVLSVFCSSFGIIISMLADTPVGSTIVAVNIACFGIFSLAGFVTRRAA